MATATSISIPNSPPVGNNSNMILAVMLSIWTPMPLYGGSHLYKGSVPVEDTYGHFQVIPLYNGQGKFILIPKQVSAQLRLRPNGQPAHSQIYKRNP